MAAEMTSAMTPDQALAALSTQHADLRDRIARCEQLADALDAGYGEPSQLLQAVAALRIAFDEHNQLEERLLRPVLLDADWLGAVRVARMVEDHVEEHQAIRRELDTRTSAELRAVLANLGAHLASEERYFLRHRVVHDDVVR
jgi:iron-sulfur cluster repair protein YtfE (RIC family)